MGTFKGNDGLLSNQLNYVGQDTNPVVTGAANSAVGYNTGTALAGLALGSRNVTNPFGEQQVIRDANGVPIANNYRFNDTLNNANAAQQNTQNNLLQGSNNLSTNYLPQTPFNTNDVATQAINTDQGYINNAVDAYRNEALKTQQPIWEVNDRNFREGLLAKGLDPNSTQGQFLKRQYDDQRNRDLQTINNYAAQSASGLANEAATRQLGIRNQQITEGKQNYTAPLEQIGALNQTAAFDPSKILTSLKQDPIGNSQAAVAPINYAGLFDSIYGTNATIADKTNQANNQTTGNALNLGLAGLGAVGNLLGVLKPGGII